MRIYCGRVKTNKNKALLTFKDEAYWPYVEFLKVGYNAVMVCFGFAAYSI